MSLVLPPREILDLCYDLVTSAVSVLSLLCTWMSHGPDSCPHYVWDCSHTLLPALLHRCCEAVQCLMRALLDEQSPLGLSLPSLREWPYLLLHPSISLSAWKI